MPSSSPSGRGISKLITLSCLHKKAEMLHNISAFLWQETRWRDQVGEPNGRISGF